MNRKLLRLFAGLAALGFCSAAFAQSSIAPASPPQSARAQLKASVVPSWELTQGAPNTCATGNFSLAGVVVNIPAAQASEQGVLTVPGAGTPGNTLDSAFGPLVGTLPSFTVFVPTAYSVPANTPITLVVTTYTDTNLSGGVSFTSRITWNCTTGALIPSPVPALEQWVIVALSLMLLATGLFLRRHASRHA